MSDEGELNQYVAARRASLQAPDAATLHAAAIIDAVQAVMDCLDGLCADELNWRPATGSGNSLPVLAAHVLGNVEEKILEFLGDQPVGRSREREFATGAAQASAVVARWSEVKASLLQVVAALSVEAWDTPRGRGDLPQLTGRALLLLVHRHASEHLGEAQLIRDLIRSRPPGSKAATRDARCQ